MDVLELMADMRSETRGGPVDRAVAALAERQHGVVARRQLGKLGLGAGAIRHRLAAGRLHRVHRGVYAVGHRRITGRGRWMAAVLACGEEALLSHRSAAALWGLAPYAGSSIDVTAPGSRRGPRKKLIVHGGWVRSEERSVHDGIPVTSVARTLLDLAEVVDRRRLERALEESERLGLFDLRAIERVCERNHGRRGLRPLLALLPSLAPAPETRSELERRFVHLCAEAELPTPVMNAQVAGFEVDALWPEHRLVVELDGYAFHRTRAAFERDRVRDAALVLAGYRVLRITARRFRDDPDSVADTIRRLVAPGGSSTVPAPARSS
jgi:very-short-patch-repair endonuclease